LLPGGTAVEQRATRDETLSIRSPRVDSMRYDNVWNSAAALLWAVAGAGLLSGCSKSKPAVPVARLEGTVTYHGRPVNDGGVSFGPLETGNGQSIWAPLDHGHYVAAAVPIGKVRVQINAVEEQGTTKSEFGATVARRVNIVPAKYRGGVVIDVRGDKLDQNFELGE
jgi:hypothetical protein